MQSNPCRHTAAKAPQSTSRRSIQFVTALALAAATLALPFLSGCVNPIGIASRPVNFGPTAVNTTRHSAITTIQTGLNASHLQIKLTGDPSFQLETRFSCPATLPAGTVCPIEIAFHPATPGRKAATLHLTQTGGVNSSANFHLVGNAFTLAPGQGMVEPTDNPLVALYAYAPTAPGKVYVSFGTNSPSGRKTWDVPTPANGDPVSIFVAGMQQDTTYHLQATEDLAGGGVIHDQAHTFATSNFPRSIVPSISVTTAPATSESRPDPQPGIELMSTTNSDIPGYLQAYATDLKGRIIWGYNYQDRVHITGERFPTVVQPVKLLPDGNMILVLSYPSQAFMDSGDNMAKGPSSDRIIPQPPGITDLIREIDLAGDPIKQITLNQINSRLAAAGYHLHIYDVHHDVTVLPNGHWIVLADTVKSETGLKGQPSPLNVVGDVIIDLNQQLKPVWVWSEFDHLDPNRHPMHFPDWTHSNAVLYSPTDGNLLVSIRHQSWVVKINYDNGKGNGKILWRLGRQGDFKLVNGASPIDWFYAEHDPSFIGSNTAGNFDITMMDNGDGRLNASGQKCGSKSFPCYSTIPILNVNTANKTATLKFLYKVPAAHYNMWGGNAEVLANGNLEFDLCSEPMTPDGYYNSTVEEITPTSTPKVVWKLHEIDANLYRARRIPSLYPGVQW